MLFADGDSILRVFHVINRDGITPPGLGVREQSS